jgi:GTP-binding protein
LGHQFLQHIERTRTLALLIPGDDIDPQATYEKLRLELRRYSEELAGKPFCVVFTKADLLPPDWPAPKVAAPEAWGQFVISSVAQRGVEALMEALWSQAAEARAERMDEVPDRWEP